MDGIFAFLFFILLMGLNIFTANKKKKKQLPKVPPMDFPQKNESNERRKSAPVSSKKTLDYMMAKPKEKIHKNNVDNQVNQEQYSQQENIDYNINQYLKKVYEYAPVKSNTKRNQPDIAMDYVRQGEIKSNEKERKIKINIEKQQIMQAITYAQVLEQPKSITYLKHFGIKRITRKD